MSKNLKRILTVIMSLAMLFSMVIPALAAPDIEIDDIDTTVPITGEGDVTFITVDDVVKIIIPTDAALDFSLDPLGLSALEEGGEGMSLEDLKAGPKAGAVTFNKYTPVVINESTDPVLVDFDIEITGGAVAPVATAALANPAVQTAARNLFIGMTVSKDSVTDLDADEDSFVGTKQLALTAASQKVQFVLDEAEYLVYLKGGNYVYEKNPDNEGYGTQLLFEGACNPYGDWSNFIAKPFIPGSPEVPATAAVVTYADLVALVEAMDSGDTIAFGSASFEMDDDFTNVATLLTALNTEFTGDWVFTAPADDFIATAAVAGKVGSGVGFSGPDAVPGAAVIDDGAPVATVTGSLVDGTELVDAVADTPAVPAALVGIDAVFSFALADGTETLVFPDDAYGLVFPAAGSWADRPSAGFDIASGEYEAGSTPRAATIKGEVGDVIVMPFNFGPLSKIEAGFPQVWLVDPVFEVTQIFDVNVAAGTITFDTDGAPAGIFEYTVWLQITDVTDFYALTLELDEPDPGP